MMIAWTGLILTVCLLPVGIWLFDRARTGRGTEMPPGRAGGQRASEPPEPALALAAQ
jgi:hypothetical protein